MSVDTATIKSALVAWIESEYGLDPNFSESKVVWGEPNGSMPNLPYIRARINTLSKVGEGYVSNPEDSIGTTIITGDREFVVFLQAFGSGALSILSSLRDSLDKVSVRDAFRLAKFCVYDSGDVIDITGLVGTKYQERASLDLFARTHSSTVDAVGIIEKVEVTETLKNEQGETVESDTYTIDSTT